MVKIMMMIIISIINIVIITTNVSLPLFPKAWFCASYCLVFTYIESDSPNMVCYHKRLGHSSVTASKHVDLVWLVS